MRLSKRLSYYNILQVSSTASQEVIRGAHRALLKDGAKHPDLGGDDLDASLINEAYQVLSDPKARQEYDYLLFSRSQQDAPRKSIVLLICTNCRTPNRLSDDNPLQQARCEKCGRNLLSPEGHKPHESVSKKAYRLGIFLFEKGLFIRAQHEFETTLKYEPNKPQLHYWIGRCQYQRRLFTQSRRSFQIAISHDENQFHYHFWDGQSLYALKSHHEAAQSFINALQLRPRHWPTMMRLASSQVRSGDANLALETLEKVIDTEPTRSEFYTLKGMVYLSLEHKKLALKAFRQAQNLSPDDRLTDKYIQILSR